jgi:colanic acid/amylovoran biosynthesis protein
MITIGLLWHSANSDNLGIGALTVSNISIVESAAAAIGETVEFRIFCWRDPGASQINKPNVKIMAMGARELVDPRKLFSWVRGCDMVLDISAGDSFSDIYGARRFRFNIISKLAVLAALRPLVLSPQTIGPFERSWARIAAKALMRSAKFVVARDSLSTDYMKTLNINDTLEATDVAFRLPYDAPPFLPSKKNRVGLNISGLLFNGGYTQNNMFGLKDDYKVLTRGLLKRFVDMPNCEVHLISHVISDRFQTEDDYRVAQQLALEFPGTILAPRFQTPSEAKSYISGLDFFAGSRMHACIAAFSSGVAVVPMAYSRKFAGLFGTLGYKAITDCKTQTADEIISIVCDGYVRRDQLKLEVDTSRALAVTKLQVYEEALRNLMSSLKPRSV